MDNKSFLNNGFLVIRNVFSKQLLIEIQKIINKINLI